MTNTLLVWQLVLKAKDFVFGVEAMVVNSVCRLRVGTEDCEVAGELDQNIGNSSDLLTSCIDDFLRQSFPSVRGDTPSSLLQWCGSDAQTCGSQDDDDDEDVQEGNAHQFAKEQTEWLYKSTRAYDSQKLKTCASSVGSASSIVGDGVEASLLAIPIMDASLFERRRISVSSVVSNSSIDIIGAPEVAIPFVEASVSEQHRASGASSVHSASSIPTDGIEVLAMPANIEAPLTERPPSAGASSVHSACSIPTDEIDASVLAIPATIEASLTERPPSAGASSVVSASSIATDGVEASVLAIASNMEASLAARSPSAENVIEDIDKDVCSESTYDVLHKTPETKTLSCDVLQKTPEMKKPRVDPCKLAIRIGNVPDRAWSSGSKCGTRLPHTQESQSELDDEKEGGDSFHHEASAIVEITQDISASPEQTQASELKPTRVDPYKLAVQLGSLPTRPWSSQLHGHASRSKAKTCDFTGWRSFPMVADKSSNDVKVETCVSDGIELYRSSGPAESARRSAWEDKCLDSDPLRYAMRLGALPDRTLNLEASNKSSRAVGAPLNACRAGASHTSYHCKPSHSSANRVLSAEDARRRIDQMQEAKLSQGMPIGNACAPYINAMLEARLNSMQGTTGQKDRRGAGISIGRPNPPAEIRVEKSFDTTSPAHDARLAIQAEKTSTRFLCPRPPSTKPLYGELVRPRRPLSAR